MANYKKWSDAEKNFIKDNVVLLSDNEIATKLSGMTGETISIAMIRRQRRKLAIVKPRGRKPSVKNIVTNSDNNE